MKETTARERWLYVFRMLLFIIRDQLRQKRVKADPSAGNRRRSASHLPFHGGYIIMSVEEWLDGTDPHRNADPRRNDEEAL